jgi:hypothetical protein
MSDLSQEEQQEIEGIDPAIVFVVAKILKHDASRGCNRGAREGL